MRKVIDGRQIFVSDCEWLRDKEIRDYINKVRQGKGVVLKKLNSKVMAGDPNNVIIDWETDKKHFERIRRITGYLVGSMDRWNAAKRAEEHDRLKHHSE